MREKCNGDRNKYISKNINRTFAVWEVRRDDEFSPLKNGTGNKDTPETCRRDLLLQHSRFIQKAGGVLK